MLNSLVIVARLAFPAQDPAPLKAELISKFEHVYGVDMKICVEDDCTILARRYPPIKVYDKEMKKEGGDEETTTSSKGASSVVIDQILSGIGSMSSASGSVTVDYKTENTKTGEKTEVHVQVEASTGKASSGK